LTKKKGTKKTSLFDGDDMFADTTLPSAAKTDNVSVVFNVCGEFELYLFYVFVCGIVYCHARSHR